MAKFGFPSAIYFTPILSGFKADELILMFILQNEILEPKNY